MDARPFELIAIGCSAGGFQALRTVLGGLPAGFAVPVAVVCHVGAGGNDRLAELLGRYCAITVEEVEDKAPLRPRTVHVAPAGYHLLLETDGGFALSVDPKVCGVRPSVDVLFESVADALPGRAIGVILTGANHDGARGLKAIRDSGGLGIVEDPDGAVASAMPAAAIARGGADHVVPLDGIAALLLRLTAEPAAAGFSPPSPATGP
ncbi:MAG: chemotaxis protein CheB [Rhodospirillaceae bacterium]